MSRFPRPPPPPFSPCLPLCCPPPQAAPSGYCKDGERFVKVAEPFQSASGAAAAAPSDAGAAAFEQTYGKFSPSAPNVAIWTSPLGAIKFVDHNEDLLKVVGLSYVATASVKGGLGAIFKAKYDYDKKLDKGNAYWYVPKSHFGSMIAVEGGNFLKAHLKTLGEISDAKHHKLELKREREEREEGGAGAVSDSSGDSPQRTMQLVVGVFKDKPKEMHLSVHAHGSGAHDKGEKYDECSVIPLAVGGDAFCLKLLDDEHIVPEQLHKRAKISTAGGGSGDTKLVHMVFGTYHKDAVPVPWYGVYSSMEEAKKEVERAEFNCFQIKTVELGEKVFNGNESQ
jgi:hypothetical protein